MNRFFSRLKTPTGVISTIAALLVGTIFYKLGFWQLDRAEEKTSILMAHETATQLAPLRSLQDDVEVALYRRVELTGKFDPQRQFLLDNRTVAGQAGFEVIAPFMISDDEYVLANLGWIGHNGDRQVTLASAKALEAETTLEGVVVTPSKGFVLGDSTSGSAKDLASGSGKTQWPTIIQFIDYETIAAKLDKIPVIDAVIIAANGHAGGYTYNFKPVASGARKHLGYAFQWFAMLFALVVLYAYLMILKQVNE